MKYFIMLLVVISTLKSNAQSIGINKYDTAKCFIQVFEDGQIKAIKSWAVKLYDFGLISCIGDTCKQTFLDSYSIVKFLQQNKVDTIINVWMQKRKIFYGFRTIQYKEPQYMLYEW